jgi:hypothetical protein
MEILYDDRTIQVIPNDGRLVKKCKNHWRFVVGLECLIATKGRPGF